MSIGTIVVVSSPISSFSLGVWDFLGRLVCAFSNFCFSADFERYVTVIPSTHPPSLYTSSASTLIRLCTLLDCGMFLYIINSDFLNFISKLQFTYQNAPIVVNASPLMTHIIQCDCSATLLTHISSCPSILSTFVSCLVLLVTQNSLLAKPKTRQTISHPPLDGSRYRVLDPR